MKIIIVGCGKVGKATIESLIKEKHNIVAIDHNPKVIEMVTNTYDVMAVCGLATSLEILQEAGVSQADLFIAVTQNDEVNMLACFLAHSLGAKNTIASRSRGNARCAPYPRPHRSGGRGRDPRDHRGHRSRRGGGGNGNVPCARAFVL